MWIKWRETSDILCDKITTVKWNGNFYKIVVKPETMNESEYRTVDKMIE